jgi:hypothetical protein
VNSNTKILINTFSKLDFRDKENSGKKKFIGIILSYLFANSVLSLNNFITFNKESFIFLSFSTGLFLLVFIVLGDFGNLFFTKKYHDVINSLPINDTEIFMSKFTSAFLYLKIYAIIIIVPQVVFFAFYETDFWEMFFFFKANYVSMFFVTGIILFLYTVGYKIFFKKSNLFLYFLQFIFFLYIIIVSSLASRISIEKSDIFSLGFVKFLPQYYFSLAVNNLFVLLLLATVTILIYFAYFFYLKKNYRKVSDIYCTYDVTVSMDKKKRSLFESYNKFICSKLIINNEEKASYLLTVNQFINSKSLKLKFIPLTFLPVIVGVIALFTDTLTFNAFKGSENSISVLTPSISFTFIMCIRLLISATKVEDEKSSGIGWIYSSLPILRNRGIQNANIKFVFVNFAFPVLAILFFLLSIKFPIVNLSVNLLFLLVAVYFINSVFLFFDRVYPYTVESTKYNSVSKLGEILFIMLIGIAIIVAQIFIFENVIFVIISILLFFVISFLLKQKSFILKSIK